MAADGGARAKRMMDESKAMTTKTQESYTAIWRPLFADGCPPDDAAVAAAWARTQQLFIEQYGPNLSRRQREEMACEMAIAWLLRALSPTASAEDTERATLAQQAALALGIFRYDLDRLYDGYYGLLQAWGVYR
jgi:hypothetical protein